MDLGVIIRDATDDDAESVTGLYNALIPSTTVTWTESLDTTEHRRHWLRRQREACRHWPRGRVSRNVRAPVSIRSPVLLVSGRLDPVTPPEYAEAVARHLPNSRHLVIPHGGHVLDGLSGVETCFDPLVLRFLERGSFEGLDAGCLAEMRPPPFQMNGQD